MLIDRKLLRFYAVLSSAVFVKAAIIAGGIFGGIALDKKFDTSPIFLVIGLFLGMGLGVYWMYHYIKRTKIWKDM